MSEEYIIYVAGERGNAEENSIGVGITQLGPFHSIELAQIAEEKLSKYKHIFACKILRTK